MITTTSYLRISPGMALIAGLAILAGCGPEPVRTTTTTTEQTTTRPMFVPPPASTTTIETQEFHRP
jgi:hypothetical protein